MGPKAAGAVDGLIAAAKDADPEFRGKIFFTLAAIGPGRFSIDRAIGWDDNISGVWWGVGALGAAVVLSFLTLTLGRTRAVGGQEPAAQT